MHRIDLNKYNIRCDLINDIDIDFDDNITNGNIKIQRINLNSKDAKRLNKKKGKYVSILFDDATDHEILEEIVEVLSLELKKILIDKSLLGKSSLIVGLGNNLSTPDSLGPKVIDNIITTRHLSEINELDKNYSCVAKIIPGVYANTGIESFDIIKGIIDRINPEFLIIIDALASNSTSKLNKVIQLTDSGIEPGSGVGNQRKELSKKTLGVEVIALGVPTVVNLHTIVKDFMYEYDIEEILERLLLKIQKDIINTLRKF